MASCVLRPAIAAISLGLIVIGYIEHAQPAANPGLRSRLVDQFPVHEQPTIGQPRQRVA